jgi:hypothetical protein
MIMHALVLGSLDIAPLFFCDSLTNTKRFMHLEIPVYHVGTQALRVLHGVFWKGLYETSGTCNPPFRGYKSLPLLKLPCCHSSVIILSVPFHENYTCWFSVGISRCNSPIQNPADGGCLRMILHTPALAICVVLIYDSLVKWNQAWLSAGWLSR